MESIINGKQVEKRKEKKKEIVKHERESVENEAT